MLYQDPEQHTFIQLYHLRHLRKGWGYFSVWSYWLSVVFYRGYESLPSQICPLLVSHMAHNWMIQLVNNEILALINLIAVKALWREVEFLVCYGQIGGGNLHDCHYGILWFWRALDTAWCLEIWQISSDQFSSFSRNGVMNFVMAFQMSILPIWWLSFIGVTTTETKNPRQVLPKLLKFLSGIFFYGSSHCQLWPIICGLILILQILHFVTSFWTGRDQWAAAPNQLCYLDLILSASATNSPQQERLYQCHRIRQIVS